MYFYLAFCKKGDYIIPTMETELFTKKDKKKLFKKVAAYSTARLRFLKQTEYDFKEIAFLTGISTSRLSELIRKQYLNEKTLVGLIGGGILKIEELIKKANLTEKEIQHIKRYAQYENKKLNERIYEVMKAGGDPEKVLSSWLKDNKES